MSHRYAHDIYCHRCDDDDDNIDYDDDDDIDYDDNDNIDYDDDDDAELRVVPWIALQDIATPLFSTTLPCQSQSSSS